MCGIAGFFTTSIKVKNKKKIIDEMIRRLHFRGPDEEGYYLDRDIALGIARLKIIDLKTGSQPIFNETKDIVVVFNGEIYNYKILRRELNKKGHKFLTQADTEVLVHLYEEYNEDMVNKLNGMFAFALYDKKEKKLFIARDRIGIKPLYYFYDKSFFAFGSELKAFIPLFEMGYIKKELSPIAVYNYLLMEYVPHPYSIYKGIFKLEPGHYLVYKDGKVKITKYWDLPFEKRLESIKKLEEEFLFLLEDSVRLRLQSDVPLGVFTSGGIDSSTITYIAYKLDPRISTFSIRFQEPSFDESKFIDVLVDYLKVKHFYKYFTVKTMLEILNDAMGYIDEPFADASILPTYLLCKFARKKITVALGGDGADELFAGYPTYQSLYYGKFFNFLPSPVRILSKNLISKLPVSYKNFSIDFKLKKFISAVEVKDIISRNFLWLGSFSPDEINKLLLSSFRLKDYNPLEEVKLPLEIGDLHPVDQISYIDIKYYLQNDILVKVDRASMANSLEVRVPFLDHRLVEFIFSLPPSYKIRFLKSKWLLKKTMKGKLPSIIVNRGKKGFGIPVAKWISNELKDLFFEYFKQTKIFNKKYIFKLLEDHLSMRYNNRKKLWTLMAFEIWFRKYF